MIGDSSVCQPATRLSVLLKNAHREIDLGCFLRRFPDGEKKFVHWSFWPSTVFTAEAVRDLTQLFATDKRLQEIMTRTKISGSEEIILPTLVALLGYQIVNSPCSYEFVQYRRRYTLQQVKAAQAKNDTFWMHPIPRSYNDPLRITCAHNSITTKVKSSRRDICPHRNCSPTLACCLRGQF